jgi:hypothetical protein
MRQIISGREHVHSIAQGLREVFEISCYEPGSCRMGKREERRVGRVWAWLFPWLSVLKPKAFFNKCLQPKGRKPILSKSRTPDNLAILGHDFRTGYHLDTFLQYPIEDQLGWHTARSDSGRDEHVGIQDSELHATSTSR